MTRKQIIAFCTLIIFLCSLPIIAAAEIAPLTAPGTPDQLEVLVDCGLELAVSARDAVPSWSQASSWAVPELKRAAEIGLIPDILNNADMTRPITREEFAELAVLLYEKTTGTAATAASPNPFTDTENPQVLKAFNLEITTGTSPTTFAPNAVTNREQVATMLSRTIRGITPVGGFSTAEAPSFSDQKDISSWAMEHVLFMARLGIIKGTDGKFMPKAVTDAQKASGYATTTREQAIAMSVRSYDKMAEIRASISSSDSSNTQIPKELTGTWEYYMNNGSSGQTLQTLELKSDGTFHYCIGMDVRSGSGIFELRYAFGASCNGKYKISAENRITLYEAIGGRYEEKTSFDDLYELIERSHSGNDIRVEKRDFTYTLVNRDTEAMLTFTETEDSDPDKLGLKALNGCSMTRTN